MQKRKLWILIESMNQEERKRFPLWLKAELRDRQTYLQQLCQILIQAFPTPPRREDIWKILYPNTNFDDGRLRKLTRDLTGWLEEFFAIEQFRSQKDEKSVALLRALYERDLPDEFEKSVRKFDREMEKRLIKDSDYFRARYNVEWLNLEFEITHKRFVLRPEIKIHSKKDQLQESAQKAQYFFDQAWIQEKLYLAFTFSSKKMNRGTEVESALLSELLEFLEKDEAFSKEHISLLYWKSYLLVTENREGSVEELIELVKEKESLLQKEALHALWVILINYHVQKLNSTGEEKYSTILISLFEWAISAGFLLVEGYLPEVYYKNIILVSLRAKEFEKAWNYLNSFKELLREQRREAVFILCKGLYFEGKKQYKEVIDTLSQTKFSRPLDEIQARTLILQAQYEIDSSHIEWLLNQLKNLDRYIRSRSNLSEEHIKPFLNRIRLFKQLVLANSEEDFINLKAKILTTRPISSNNWLLEKVTSRLK